MRAVVVTALAGMLGVAGARGASFDELAREAAEARRGNRVDDAIQLYRRALQANAAWPEGWWFLGTLSYASFHYGDGEEALSQFVKLDDKRGLAWALLGLCEFETGKYDRAMEHLERGLAPGSGVPPDVATGVRFHYGLALTRQGLFERGHRALERLAKGCDEEPMLVLGIGLNALHQALIPKEVPADRQDLIAKAGAASCAWMLGSAEKADPAFRTLVVTYPATAGVHYLYGTYLLPARADDARQEFQRELELDAANADARAMLSLMMGNAGDSTGALAQAKKALDGEQIADALTEYAYGEALLRAGDWRPAVSHLENAERIDPESLDYHLALVGVYSKAGRNDDARRERRTSLEMAMGQHGN
jgi:tetratricopeptide (TPR) repeat protein